MGFSKTWRQGGVKPKKAFELPGRTVSVKSELDKLIPKPENTNNSGGTQND